MTLTPVAKLFTVKLSLPVLRIFSVAAGIRTPNLPHFLIFTCWFWHHGITCWHHGGCDVNILAPFSGGGRGVFVTQVSVTAVSVQVSSLFM